MYKVLVLFLIGLVFGISVPMAEKGDATSKLLDEPLPALHQIFVASSRLWHLAISVLILITLPAAIFKTIRNRMTKKQFLPIPFMTGISFGFTFMGLLGLIATQL